MRLIKTLQHGTKIYRNVEWNEFVVKPPGSVREVEWYYTDDRSDAEDTADAMESRRRAEATHQSRIDDDTTDLY